MKTALYIVFFFFSFSSFGQQDNNNDSNRVFDCYDGTQLEMNICSQNEYQYYDSLLNKTYQELMNMINEEIKEVSSFVDKTELDQVKSYKNTILESQRHWIKQRDLNATIQAEMFKGGTMAPMAVNQQKTKDTRQRISFLTELLELEGY